MGTTRETQENGEEEFFPGDLAKACKISLEGIRPGISKIIEDGLEGALTKWNLRRDTKKSNDMLSPTISHGTKRNYWCRYSQIYK